MGVGAVEGAQSRERWRDVEDGRASWAERSQTHIQIQKETQNQSETQTAPEEMGRRQSQGREGGPEAPGAGEGGVGAPPASAFQSDPGPAAQPLGRQQGCPVPGLPPRYLWAAASPRPAAT